MAMTMTLQPGHFMAVKNVELHPPFSTQALLPGENFDILEVNPESAQVLIKHEGLRVWKDAAHLAGKVVCLVPNRIVSGDGLRFVDPVSDECLTAPHEIAVTYLSLALFAVGAGS